MKWGFPILGGLAAKGRKLGGGLEFGHYIPFLNIICLKKRNEFPDSQFSITF